MLKWHSGLGGQLHNGMNAGQNEAQSREDFDSKPKKNFFALWKFWKKNSRFFFGNFFQIFFLKKRLLRPRFLR